MKEKPLRDLPHASSAALDRLEDLLSALRALKGMRETSRGRFYRRGRTFLHFHERGDDLVADVKWNPIGWEFERVRVTDAAERRALLARVEASLHPRIGLSRPGDLIGVLALLFFVAVPNTQRTLGCAPSAPAAALERVIGHEPRGGGLGKAAAHVPSRRRRARLMMPSAGST